MTANKKAKKITGDKAASEKYFNGGWAKADDRSTREDGR